MKSITQPIIRLAYADHYSIVRRSISSFISSYGCFEVEIQAENGEELIRRLKVAPSLPDICILDINMPIKNGYETIKEIKELWPGMKFLVLTAINKDYTILQMIKSGANGYLLKSCEPDELYRGLTSIYKTGYFITDLTSQHIFNFLKDGQNPLSKINKKELHFLSLCCTDYTYSEIAEIMHVSPRTVQGYRDILFEKLHVKTRLGLAIFAMSIGIVSFQ
jgi:two-component system, NarL family, invasion response regulator UvrY